LDDIKNILTYNDELLADFPEVCLPIRALDGVPHRANHQMCGGERTQVVYTSDCLQLPTIKTDWGVSSGSIVQPRGLTGRLRGMSRTLSNGTTIRPDCIILDDP
jgi:hypothetical protein